MTVSHGQIRSYVFLYGCLSVAAAMGGASETTSLTWPNGSESYQKLIFKQIDSAWTITVLSYGCL